MRSVTIRAIELLNRCNRRPDAVRATERARAKVAVLARTRPHLRPLEQMLGAHSLVLTTKARVNSTRALWYELTEPVCLRDSCLRDFERAVADRDFLAAQEPIAICAECLRMSTDDLAGRALFIQVTRDGRAEDLCHPCASELIRTEPE
jgi:hypothetical protein